MFKNLLFINFIISSCIGLIIYFFQKSGIQLHRFINNHTNDFLIIPIVLSVSLFLLRGLRNDKNFRLSLGIIIYIVICYSLFFELLMPKLNERYTLDIIDVLMYALGGFWFWLLQRI